MAAACGIGAVPASGGRRRRDRGDRVGHQGRGGAPPGGGFGVPVPIGRARATDVAVAPGGWVALARDVDDATTTTVLAPDGRSTLGDRGPGGSPRARRSASTPAGLRRRPGRPSTRATSATSCTCPAARREPSAPGPTTSTPSGARRRSRSRSPRLGARSSPGPTAAASVPRSTAASSERLSTEVGAGSPAVAVADDGSAVVAYAGMRERVLVASRGAGGAWTLPRPARPAPGDTVGGLAQNYLEMLIAGGRDGVRAAVAWRAPDIVGDRAFAASGRPGGEWTPAAPLLAVTRDAFSPELLVAPDGTLRAAWSELRPRVGGDLFRAARLSPTPSPDTTPPAIDTRLPARTKLTRNGRVSFRIPVTCSEACDARVRVISRQGHESVVDVRELPAGRSDHVPPRPRGGLRPRAPAVAAQPAAAARGAGDRPGGERRPPLADRRRARCGGAASSSACASRSTMTSACPRGRGTGPPHGSSTASSLAWRGTRS